MRFSLINLSTAKPVEKVKFVTMTAWYIIPLVPSAGNPRLVNRLIHLSDLVP